MKRSGFSIIEIIVAASIISIIGFTVISSTRLFIQISARNSNNIQAAIILEETAEALQFLRDQSWTNNFSNLSVNYQYYLHSVETGYYITTESYGENKFERIFTLSEIRRDVDDKIADSGYVDEGTLLVDIQISWQEGVEKQFVGSKMLIHNAYNN